MLNQLRVDPFLIYVAVVIFYPLNSFKSTCKHEIYYLRHNETENFDNGLVCNHMIPKCSYSFRKEQSWLDNIKGQRRHTQFYIDILKRDFEDLIAATPEEKSKNEYLGIPINLFYLRKRIVKDWTTAYGVVFSLSGIFDLYADSQFSRLINSKLRRDISRPDSINAGYRFLQRLHTVYYHGHSTSKAGLIKPSRDSILSALDKFEAAKFFCTENSIQQSKEWLAQVEDILNHSLYLDVPEEEFMELNYILNCMIGNKNVSKTYYQSLLEKNPAFRHSSRFNTHYEQIIWNGCERLKTKRDHMHSITGKTLNLNKGGSNARFLPWDIDDIYNPRLMDLCNYQAVYNYTARLLKCRYIHYNKPNLMIGPFKMEEHHIDPPILMFHEVISDKEINEIVQTGRPYMKKAIVYSDYGNEVVNTSFRNSAHMWLPDWSLATAAALSKRTALMTGWNLAMSYENQLASYGPAGEFTFHKDANAKGENTLNSLYGTYSTVMFYINDVEKGGHTIFPVLNVSIVPQKRSAVLWINEELNGLPDLVTVHAACPVLQGQKWVINKWFYSATQDFPRCTENKETAFRYYYV